MNKKVYKTLEYNKILTMLSSYAACDETKKRCLSLELSPIYTKSDICRPPLPMH